MKKDILAGLVLLALSSNSFGAKSELLGGLFGGAIGSLIGKSASTEDVEKSLALTAEKINQKTPTMSDAETRVDRATAGPGRQLTYHHTMINLDRKNANLAIFNGEFTNGLRAKICANPGMKPIFANGVTLVYSYRSRDGQQIGAVSVEPKHCGL